MTINTGILIIGSLWWDDENGRGEWRERHLDADHVERVNAPIYYGRWSGGRRRRCFTMTFDVRAPERCMVGTALLVPCKNAVSSFDDLFCEARALWRAEAPGSADDDAIGAKWGSVGLLCKDDGLGADWRDSVERGNILIPDESWFPVDGESGLARINWPLLADGGGETSYGAILVAATLQEECYPTVDTVASHFNRDDEYFRKNRAAGITTANDGAIEAAMREQSEGSSSELH